MQQEGRADALRQEFACRRLAFPGLNSSNAKKKTARPLLIVASLGSQQWHYLSIRTVVDPVVPPADAEIVTLPSFNARTRPVLLTVARFVFELLQLNWTPVITLLDASYAVAVN